MFKKQQMTLKIAKISKAIEKIDGDMKFVGHEIKLRNSNQTLSKWFLKKKNSDVIPKITFEDVKS